MTSTLSQPRVAWPAAVLVAGIVIAAGAWLTSRDSASSTVAEAAAAEDPIDHAAMGHTGHGAADGGSSLERAPVELDAKAAAAIGVQFEAVRQESIRESLRAVATLVPDESRLMHVHTRVAGWVEQLAVNTTGQRVRAGEVLARIFSQELLASQTEYLMARRHAATGLISVVVDSGRSRLRVLGMSNQEIAAIEQTGQPMPLVSVYAPRGGVVVNRGVTVGTAVDPSTELMTIADLSRVWVVAEVPEHDIPRVTVGTPAQLEFPAAGGQPLRARVEFLSPTLSEQTRTLAVRLSAANTRGNLRPGLYGTAVFETAARDALTITREAVVDTGDVQHVFVECHGRVLPRIVTLGSTIGDRVEVLDGLIVGERVASSAVFLLDSESRLRATGIDAHAGH